jgi:putative acetyltransferase
MDEGDLIFRTDDLSDPRSQALVRRHLAGMHENSPAESVHAFDINALRQPGVTFWTGSLGGEPVVMGALRELDRDNGELKSMRVADAWLGRGLGRRMLEHLMSQARDRGLRQLWLETGTTPAFAPAIRLYESAGFIACGPFGSYTDDPFSRFMTRRL